MLLFDHAIYPMQSTTSGGGPTNIPNTLYSLTTILPTNTATTAQTTVPTTIPTTITYTTVPANTATTTQTTVHTTTTIPANTLKNSTTTIHTSTTTVPANTATTNTNTPYSSTTIIATNTLKNSTNTIRPTAVSANTATTNTNAIYPSNTILPANTPTTTQNTMHTTPVPINTTVPYNTIKNPTSVTAVINPVTNAIYTTANSTIRYVCVPPAVYNSISKACSTPQIISPLNLSTSQLAQLSSTIGVSVNVISAISISIFNGTNSITVRCNGCTGIANSTSGITTINTNAPLPAGTLMGILSSTNAITPATVANAFAKNNSLVNGIVSSSTPYGFSVLNTTVLTGYNTTAQNTVTIQWSSTKFMGTQNVSTNSIRSAATSLSATNSPTPSQLTAQFALHYLGNVSNVSVSSQAEVHAVVTVQSLTSTTQYVPSNITVYSSKSTSVVSVTNLVKNVSSYVNTTRAKGTALASLVVVPKNNITALAAGIHVYNSSASNVFSGNIISKQTFGNVISMMMINSSVKDSLLNKVQYKFNISKKLLSSRNLTTNAVRLYRHNSTSGKWYALPTSLTGSNGTQYFFTATSPGFSFYAISFGYIETNITSVTNSTPTVQPPSKVLAFPMEFILATVLLFVVVVLIAYFVFMKKGNPKSPPGAGMPPQNPPEMGVPPQSPPRMEAPPQFPPEAGTRPPQGPAQQGPY